MADNTILLFDKLAKTFTDKYRALLAAHDYASMQSMPPITMGGFTIRQARDDYTQAILQGGTFNIPYYITDSSGRTVRTGEGQAPFPSDIVGGTDYDGLTDKPSINSVTLQGNKTSSDLSLADEVHTHTTSDISGLATVATTGDYDDLSDKPFIPTKTSDLNNDSLFLRGDTAGVYRGTSTTSGSTGTKSVTCSNFTSSQLQIGVLVMVDFTHDNSASVDDLKLNVNATGAKGVRMMKNGHVSKLPAASFIQTIRTYPFYYDGDYWIMIVDNTPTKVSELTNDSGFLTSESDPVFTASDAYGITSTDITAWNNKSDFSGSYNDLTDKPTIPVKNIWYATCSTGASTTAKTATSSTADFTLATGNMVRVLFTNTNTATSPTISIDGSTAKNIRIRSGSTGAMTYMWRDNEVLDLVYDGTNFVMSDGAIATTTYYGVTSLSSSTSSTSETEAATPKAVKTAYDLANGKADAVHTHTKSDITDFPTIPTKVSDLTNDSGFITSETDPVFTASAAYGISSSDITAWNGKSTVSINRKTSSGTNIADITIDGTTTQLYAPSGGGGTSDYDSLSNRPQINSTTLTGDKSSSDLGLADASHSHTTSDITDFPSLATVATTGDYDDLIDKPSDYTYATTSANGVHGLVPAPLKPYNPPDRFQLLTSSSGWQTAVMNAAVVSSGPNTGKVRVSLSARDNGSVSNNHEIAAILPNATTTSAGTMSASDKTKLDGAIDTAGTGLSKSSTTLNHSNSITAQTTQAVYPIKIDSTGHISEYGSAVTIPTVNNATLTIQKNSTNVATFTANASSNVTANISVPTTASDVGALSISAVADYITSKGTSGNWYYEKWANGKIEAVFKGSVTYKSMAASGQLFRSTNNAVAIPSGIFTTTPQRTEVTVNNSATVVVCATAVASSATNVNVQVWRSTNANSSVDMTIRCIYTP